MFVSLLSFFYKISDDSVGGIYLTLLKTATLAGTCVAMQTQIKSKLNLLNNEGLESFLEVAKNIQEG